jgi:DNA-binding NarL/FixJ family response regulator
MAETWVSMEELTEFLGRDKARLLCRLKGGIPFYVPGKADPRHALAGAIGEFGMRRLCQEFPGEYITVPNGNKLEPKKPEVKKLLKEGKSHKAVAETAGVTERYVRMVAAGIGNDRQLTLFPLPG